MSAALNRQILLASYPQGAPRADNFELVKRQTVQPGAEQVLVRTLYLSMDPFPRLRMDPQSRMGPPLPLGSVVIGRGVGKVVASNAESIPMGAYVAGDLGWQDYAVCDAAGVRAIDPKLAPVRTSLGVLGPSGVAAYIALFDEGRPQAGETVLVTAAAGAVGSIAGQLARLHGCRVAGVCIGSEQAQYLREELQFDAAIDARADRDLAAAIRKACPQGVDVLLDSVGGETHNAAIMNMNVRGRAVIFGYISAYNAPAGAEPEYGRIYEVLRRRLRVTGFLVGDHAARFPAAVADIAQHYRAGRLRFREHITRGLENAPGAFAALFTEAAPGKQLVEVSSEE